MVNNEELKKITNCVLIEKSKNKDRIATIQAPTAKKKRIKPGTTNSNKKRIKPARNHITAGLLKLFI